MSSDEQETNDIDDFDDEELIYCKSVNEVMALLRDITDGEPALAIAAAYGAAVTIAMLTENLDHLIEMATYTAEDKDRLVKTGKKFAKLTLPIDPSDSVH